MFVPYAEGELDDDPDLDLNAIESSESVAIALWYRLPGPRDVINESGFNSLQPIYVRNVLSRPINEELGYRKALFVSSSTKQIFFFNK